MGEQLSSGNYVIAGASTFVNLLDKFLKEKNERNYFDATRLSNFFNQTVNRYLISFGEGLSYKTRKIPDNHVSKFSEDINLYKNKDFMKNTNVYIDSGGFQVSMGALETKDMPQFIENYHNFLQNSVNDYTFAFSLDLIPGPGSSEIFTSFNEVENLNRQSYKRSSEMTQNIKDKLIYIHHFRTPALYKIYNKFLWDENLAEGFINFGTGGIVANSGTDTTVPVIIYTIPLSSIIRYAKRTNMKFFRFHVLGGANYTDVFYHKLFSYHIKKVHGIEVQITYDSSAMFKALMIGRFIPVIKQNGALYKMDIRSGAMHLQFDKCTIQDQIYQVMNEMSDQFGFKRLDPEIDPIYDKETNTFPDSIRAYLMLYMLNIYRQIEYNSEKYVEEIYPLFSTDVLAFDKKCLDFTSLLNQGKQTKKQKIKTYSIYKSLNVLTDLDESYNEYIINKFMSGDDMNLVKSNLSTLKF